MAVSWVLKLAYWEVAVLLRAMRDAALIILSLEAMVMVLAVGGLMFVAVKGLGRGREALRDLLGRVAEMAAKVERWTIEFAENPLSGTLPLAGLMFNLGRRVWPMLRRLQRGE